MLTIVIIQSGLALMTISPSLNSQFNVNRRGDQYHSVYSVRVSHYSEGRYRAKVANFVAFVGAMYRDALYSSGEEAMLYSDLPWLDTVWSVTCSPLISTPDVSNVFISHMRTSP